MWSYLKPSTKLTKENTSPINIDLSEYDSHKRRLLYGIRYRHVIVNRDIANPKDKKTPKRYFLYIQDYQLKSNVTDTFSLSADRNAVNNLRNSALEKMYDAFSPGANAFEDFAEMRGTLKKFLTFEQRSFFTMMAHGRGHGLRALGRNTSEGWIIYNFLFRPTMGQIEKVNDSRENYLVSQEKHTKKSEEFEPRLNVSGGYLTAKVKYKITGGAWFRIGEHSKTKQLFGLYNLPYSIWQTVGWSWLIDSFIDVSSLLKNLDFGKFAQDRKEYWSELVIQTPSVFHLTQNGASHRIHYGEGVIMSFKRDLKIPKFTLAVSLPRFRQLTYVASILANKMRDWRDTQVEKPKPNITLEINTYKLSGLTLSQIREMRRK